MKFEIINAGDLKEGDLFVNLEKTPTELNDILSKGVAIGVYIRGRAAIPEENTTEKVYRIKVSKPRREKDTPKA